MGTLTGQHQKQHWHQIWTTVKVAWSDESHFVLRHMDSCVFLEHFPVEEIDKGWQEDKSTEAV